MTLVIGSNAGSKKVYRNKVLLRKPFWIIASSVSLNCRSNGLINEPPSYLSEHVRHSFVLMEAVY